jgi:hypothetical protein
MEGNRRPIYLIIAISALALLSISAQAADTGKSGPPYVEVPKDHIAMHRGHAVAMTDFSSGGFDGWLRSGDGGVLGEIR